MEKIKEAFHKVKQDIEFLKQEVDLMNSNLFEINSKVEDLFFLFQEFNIKKEEDLIESSVYIPQEASTQESIIQTTPTDNPTHQHHFKPLKDQNILISTGNLGVPTDRQTDRQTDRHMEMSPKIEENNNENTLDEALEILDSLDSIKKEIRLKFKRLTDQEFSVFSALYLLEEENGFTDYKSLSKKLGLSESSIRDYIGRLLKKGIPVDKKRINNKNIHLFVAEKLKKIVTLPTILQLRDI